MIHWNDSLESSPEFPKRRWWFCELTGMDQDRVDVQWIQVWVVWWVQTNRCTTCCCIVYLRTCMLFPWLSNARVPESQSEALCPASLTGLRLILISAGYSPAQGPLARGRIKDFKSPHWACCLPHEDSPGKAA